MSKKMTYNESLVRCPYYLREDTFTITCEGVLDETTIRQHFTEKEKKEGWHREYCERKYANCFLCRQIERCKYGGAK